MKPYLLVYGDQRHVVRARDERDALEQFRTENGWAAGRAPIAIRPLTEPDPEWDSYVHGERTR